MAGWLGGLAGWLEAWLAGLEAWLAGPWAWLAFEGTDKHMEGRKISPFYGASSTIGKKKKK